MTDDLGGSARHPDWSAESLEGLGGVPPTARGGGPIPVEVLTVAGLLCLAGLFLVVPALQALPDSLDMLTAGDEFSRGFGALVLSLILIIGAAGAACLCLAVMLCRADRVGRILTVIVAATVVLSLLSADARSGWDNWALVFGIGAIAALTLMPNARLYFTGPRSLQRDQPEPVVAARALLVSLAFVLGAVGVTYLAIGPLDGKFYAIGLGMAAVSAVLFSTNKKVGQGDAQARTVATGLMAAYVVLLLWAQMEGTGLVLPLVLALAVPTLLWLPESSQAHFRGDVTPI